jgi:hypothetical protein
MRSWILPTTFLAALAAPVMPAAPGHALNCVGPEGVVGEAPTVFVGRIVDGGDGRIEVDVDEVWKGQAASEVTLRVSLEGWWIGGEIPQGYAPRGRWVFAPDENGAVNVCTAWSLRGRPLREQLLEHRPEQVIEPDADAFAPDRSVPPAVNNIGEHHWTDDLDTPRGVTLVALGGIALLLGLLGALGLRHRTRARG